MPGLIALERGRLLPFLLSMAAAASFHSTALVMLDLYCRPYQVVQF